MRDRRHFLRTSAVVSLSPTLPTFLSNAALTATHSRSDNGRILVVIQLDGGNDGINTVVPFKDEGYAQHRKELRLPENDLIKVTNDFAFHPRLRSASELFEEGRLSIVHGVGYPNPNRSHFESMAIWHTGSMDEELRRNGTGWIGEAISMRQTTSRPHAIHVGDEALPVALRGRRCTATTISNPTDLRLDLAGSVAHPKPSDDSDETLAEFLTKNVSEAYASADELTMATRSDANLRYPTSKLAHRLKLVSQMIKSGAVARVYYTSQSGYDTHAAQLPTHAALLGELSSSLKAFMDDLMESGLEDRVLVMAFSEFGRRVAENASIGTDHGTAGPVVLAGANLAHRSYGLLPKLTDLDSGDLKHTIDFRQVYSAVLSDWLDVAAPTSLQGFKSVELFENFI
jgi:uncharacterized protein (DUF1501 family)